MKNISKKSLTNLISLVAFVFTSAFQICLAQESTIIGELSAKSNDTLSVYLTQNSITRLNSKHEIPLNEGNFKLTWSIKAPAYVYIKKGDQSFSGIIEPGENITLKIDSLQVTLMQNAAFKISTSLSQFKTSLIENKSARLKALINTAKQQKMPFDYLFNFADSAMNVQLNALDAAKNQLSKEAHLLLIGDIKGYFLSMKYNIPTYIYNETHLQTLESRSEELSPRSKQEIKNRLNFDESLAGSDRYAESVYTLLFKEYSNTTMGNNNHKLTDKYTFINETLPSALKLPVLTLFIESDLSKLNQGEDLEEIIAETIANNEKSPYSLYILSRIQGLFKKGNPAPAFSVTGSNGKQIKLSDFKGKVVLIDFWFKDCIPCHALFEKIRPVKNHYSENKNVVFLNISIDNKIVWQQALKQFNIGGLHAYTDGKASKHPIITAYKVAAYPTTTLIDKNGNIFLATPSDQPQELIKQIEEALKIN